VSSINAAAGSALLPIAEADEMVAVIPAAYADGRLRDVLQAFDTIILMKVNKTIDRALNILDELGLKDRAVFVERAGWPEERIVRDLNSLKGKTSDYFSLVIVKK
ncbi:MAG: SAM-dependent methyltransferase, partial [Deltaproteobacteria bacterium]